MARPVSRRVSYRRDAAFVLRLEEAIGLDTIRSPSWKARAASMARAFAQMLLTAEQDSAGSKKGRGADDESTPRTASAGGR